MAGPEGQGQPQGRGEGLGMARSQSAAPLIAEVTHFPTTAEEGTRVNCWGGFCVTLGSGQVRNLQAASSQLSDLPIYIFFSKQ